MSAADSQQILDRLIRRHVKDLAPYEGVEPPEVLAERVGITPDRVVKLDANENPYGASPHIVDALAGFPWTSIYPDPAQRRVRAGLAAYTGADVDRIIAGSGADELIDLVLRLFIDPGDRVIDLTPTFGMYAVCSRIQGGSVVRVPRDDSFDVDVAAVGQAVDDRTKLVFLCNPNNPSGNVSPESCVRDLLDLGLMVVVDETYHEFCGFTVAHLVPEYENLIVLRSLSKWAGLAGLRLGYGIMAPFLVERLMAIKQPYNVSTSAEAALFASLEDTDLLLHRVRLLVEERERMVARLQELPGVHCYPSKANFVLCRLPEGTAPWLQGELARRGIFVRHFSAPRVSDCLRISSGRPEHTDALVDAMKELLKQ